MWMSAQLTVQFDKKANVAVISDEKYASPFHGDTCSTLPIYPTD